MKSLIFATVLALAAAILPAGAGAQATSPTPVAGVTAWPEAGAFHRGRPLLVVLFSQPQREIPCRFDSLAPDALVCDKGRESPPAVYPRAAIALIETAPRDFSSLAKTFFKGGLVMLGATALCAAVSGSNPACIVTFALSGGLVVTALACTLIETGRIATGNNRRRVLYAAVSHPETHQSIRPDTEQPA